MFLKKNQSIIFFTLIALSALIYVVHLKIWSILPIYSDEISYRFFTTRAMLDDWHRIALFPTCVSSAYLPIPFVFYPAAFVLSLYALITDMQLYRYFGMAVFTLTLTLGCLTAARYIFGKHARLITAAFVLTLLALFIGVLPTILFMLRPEHIIFLAVIFSCWVATRTPANSWLMAALQICFVILFYSMAIYTHPKAIYFAPGVALVILFRAWRWRVLATGALVLLVAIVGFGVHINMIQFMHCPENPALEAAIRNQNINPMDALKSPLDFIKNVITLNIDRSWKVLIEKMTFSNHYDGGGSTGYLPAADDGSPFAKLVNALVIISQIVTALFAILFVFLNIRAVISFWRKAAKNQKLQTLFSIDQAAFPLLLSVNYLCLITQFLLNRNQVFYDVEFWLVLFTFFNGFSLVYHCATNLNNKHETTLKYIVTPVLVLHLVCALLSCKYATSTIYQDYLSDKPVLGVTLHDSKKTNFKSNTLEALKMCGLQDSTPKLVHDDFTYPHLQKSYYPLSVSWTFAALQDEAHVLPWFKEIGASGIVMDCRMLRSAFKFPEKRISVSGPICCVNLNEAPQQTK